MPAPLIVRGKPNSGSAIHYALTHSEHVALRGSYVDPDRYKEGHRDYAPEVICLHGGFHLYATRDWSRVTCPACLSKKNTHA